MCQHVFLAMKTGVSQSCDIQRFHLPCKQLSAALRRGIKLPGPLHVNLTTLLRQLVVQFLDFTICIIKHLTLSHTM